MRGVEPYIINVMNEQGIDAQPPEIHTKQLVGVASDGRSLATLVDQSEAVVYEQIRKGASRVTALKDGLTWMSLVTTTLLSDAGRSADGIGIASTKQVTGYYRQLNGKSCSRCVVLAGRFYKNNKGFKRHPKCDCRNVPAGEFDPQFALSPEEYFSALTPKERQETFGIAGARAIEDGADIARVVNADRGMYTTSRAKFTKEIADFSPNGVRLMPETIYDLYPDPKDAVRALKRHGYIS